MKSEKLEMSLKRLEGQMAWISGGASGMGEAAAKFFLDVAHELVVEILSPHDSWSNVTQKLREYFAIGVQLIWVVDPQGG